MTQWQQFPTVGTPRDQEGRVQATPDRGVRVSGSFGPENTTFGPVNARQFIESQRYRELDRRQSYYECAQHDWKKSDFEGHMIQPGPPLSQPMLSSEQSPYYVPLRERRPSQPYRLARLIVNSFTTLLFSHDRWPELLVPGDADAQDFLREVVRVTNLRTAMIRARNVGGSVGTVCLSWRWWKGKPRVQVHNGKNVFVREWEDREELIPKVVSELWLTQKEVWDPAKRMTVPKWYWWRRDWTPDADVYYELAEDVRGQEPDWRVKAYYPHNDGFAHLVWIPNLPDTGSDTPDGVPDYEGLYENFDALDMTGSVLTRGTTLNLDPTLILKMDPDLLERQVIRKGSDNSIAVGESGDAHYMELGGSSVTAGLALFEKMRSMILEVAQCVVADPNQAAAQGTSSVALKVIYEPMTSKADMLRTQYGDLGILRLLDQILRSARRVTATTAYGVATRLEAEAPEGAEPPVEKVIDLDPRVVQQPKVDPVTGEATDETEEVEVPRTPGTRGTPQLVFGQYFTPTSSDRQQEVTVITTATGGSVLSEETGSQLTAKLLGVDPRAEWQKLSTQRKAQADIEGGMTPPIGNDDEPPVAPEEPEPSLGLEPEE